MPITLPRRLGCPNKMLKKDKQVLFQLSYTRKGAFPRSMDHTCSNIGFLPRDFHPTCSYGPSRSGRTRTGGLLPPRQARYPPAPHSEKARWPSFFYIVCFKMRSFQDGCSVFQYCNSFSESFSVLRKPVGTSWYWMITFLVG